MKRKLLATALIGTSLVALCGHAGAADCKQIKSNAELPCREIPHKDLGPQYCLAVETFNFRAMKSSAAADPWSTGHSIKLAPYPVKGPKCTKQISFRGDALSIAKRGDDYNVVLSGKTPVSFDATMTKDGDNDLWLGGTDKEKMHYFVFFRDQLSANGNLPKFLVVEALDGDEPSCIDNAPKLATPTVKNGPCIEPLRNPKLRRESGVGGGGEFP